MRLLAAMVAVTLLASRVLAAPQVGAEPGQVRVAFDNGVKLTFTVSNGLLLGLNKAEIDGVTLKSDQTLQRPVLAQDLPTDTPRMIWPFLRLKDAKVQGQQVQITCELLGTSDPRAIDDFFVTSAEPAKAGHLHRDAHRWPMLQQPEAICGVAHVKQLAATLKDTLKPSGTLVWTLEADNRNIAGWNWAGWKQSYAFELSDGQKVGALRQLGTWELDGQLAGLTAVNLRFRGLGGIEQPFTADARGGVKEAWTTTETMPGAVDKAPVIAPAVPASVQVNDRGYALRHRAGAWISRMARGGGTGFVDFQYRPQAALCSFFEKQGNLRALSEAYPGDKCLSQTDEELFARTSAFKTQPQVYLALVTKDRPLAIHESRTRWQEIDQYVRDLVSTELGFVQYEPLPGVGTLADAGWADYYKALARSGADTWGKMGVRMVCFHNPGWINGRYQGPKGDPDAPPKTGGGVCLVYDWIPAKDIQQPWHDASAAMARNHIAYYPWIGNYNWAEAPFVKSVGLQKEHWSVKADGVTQDDNASVLGHNYLDPAMRQAWLDRLEHARQTWGFQGFWVDSFQSSGMHRFTPDEAHAPQQRVTWELLAQWSRKGVGFMSESHAFPGLSCSIEVPGWQKDYWFFQYVWRWYRNQEELKPYKPADLDRMAFRFMANKCWTAPDMSYRTDDKTVLPSFSRLAHEYLAALPDMRRSYILENERGVLWLPYSGNGTGVWFAFSSQALPEGVTATYILDQAPATEAAGERTYRVKADDLLKRFGVRTGPAADPRIGRKYETPAYEWPVK